MYIVVNEKSIGVLLLFQEKIKLKQQWDIVCEPDVFVVFKKRIND